MTNISRNLAMIHNLYNTAIWHKEHCKESCNVSLVQLREVAQDIAQELDNIEIIVYRKMYGDWPN